MDIQKQRTFPRGNLFETTTQKCSKPPKESATLKSPQKIVSETTFWVKGKFSDPPLKTTPTNNKGFNKGLWTTKFPYPWGGGGVALGAGS